MFVLNFYLKYIIQFPATAILPLGTILFRTILEKSARLMKYQIMLTITVIRTL